MHPVRIWTVWTINTRACYDIVAQAMGGMVNLTGFKDTDPVKVGPSVADDVSGILLTVGVWQPFIIVI